MRINLLHNFPRWMLTCMFALSSSMTIAMESPAVINSHLKPKVFDLVKLGLLREETDVAWTPGEGRFAITLKAASSNSNRIGIIRSNDLALIDLIDVPNNQKITIEDMSFNPNNSNELFYTHSNNNGIQEFCIRDSSTKTTRSKKVVDAPNSEVVKKSLWSNDGSEIFVTTQDDNTRYSMRVVSSRDFGKIEYSVLPEQLGYSFDVQAYREAWRAYQDLDWYDSDDEDSGYCQSPTWFEKEGRVLDVVPALDDPTRIVMTTYEDYIVIQQQGTDGIKEITSCGNFNAPVPSILKLSPHGTYALDLIFRDAIVCHKTEQIRRAALAGAPNTTYYRCKPGDEQSLRTEEFVQNRDSNNNN